MFRSRAAALGWELREGAQVEARALVTMYEARGRFQLNVEAMRLGGLGPLYERFLRLKEKLEGEGLFDPAAKRAPPQFPRAIGVVTSLQAAALRDVLTTLARRNRTLPVIVYPVPVQGEGAARRIAMMLATANSRAECDVLLLVRGGGSIEDLWQFNEEGLARAIRASRIAFALTHNVQFFQSGIGRLQVALTGLDPSRVLARGYSITLDAQGKVVTSSAQVREGERITTRLSQGSLDSEVRLKE